MKYLFIILYSFFLYSCTADKASEMGKKWCECNSEMGKLFGNYLSAQKSDNQEKMTEFAALVLKEQSTVLECLGGEKALLKINGENNDPNFQKRYDKSREKYCPELVKLLNTK